MLLVTPPPEPIVFDLTQHFGLFIEYFSYVLAWSKTHWVMVGVYSFTFYDLFFSAWAIMLICSWIPVIQDFVGDHGISAEDPDDFDDDGYFWYD